MCGLCGVAYADPQHSVDAGMVRRMNATLAHRGPDDDGIFLDGPIGMGHRRLSIVDLSTGHQPMSNEDGSVTIVYNGETYNHADLRPGLEGKGHLFRTRSDTEVIVHLLEEEGPAGAARLRGMFAFAIWDSRQRSLVLARDHSGIKPLYYALTARGDILFGSEIKALFASGLLVPEIDTATLPEFLATGHVSGERTMFQGVRKLRPGTTLTWRNGQYTTERFWSLPPATEVGSVADATTLAEAGEEFWRRFVESVRLQLMSDVPLGAFLSGGLDSSLLVAAMRELGVADLNTFSVGYAEAAASELPWARVAAREFDTTHHEIQLGSREFFDALPRLTWHRDLPLTFSASIPLHAVSQLAVGHVKVVLTGEGSDELFAGYGRYPRALANLRWARRCDAALPRLLRRGLARMASSAGDGWLGSRVGRSFLAQPGHLGGAYLEAFAEIGGKLRQELLPGVPARAAWDEPARLLDADLAEVNPLEAMLRYDQATYLEELLMKQDAMSMASSLESRVPFLDHGLVEWAGAMAPSLKLRGFAGKALVREAARTRLPAVLLQGPKRGFLVPVGDWLRGAEGRGMVEDTLFSTSAEALLSRTALRRVWDRHRSGTDATAQLWRLFAFRLWQVDTVPRLERLAATTSGGMAAG